MNSAYPPFSEDRHLYFLAADFSLPSAAIPPTTEVVTFSWTRWRSEESTAGSETSNVASPAGFHLETNTFHILSKRMRFLGMWGYRYLQRGSIVRVWGYIRNGTAVVNMPLMYCHGDMCDAMNVRYWGSKHDCAIDTAGDGGCVYRRHGCTDCYG